MTKTDAKSMLKRAYSAFAAESMVFLIAYIAIVVGLPIIIDPSTFAPASIQAGLADYLVRLWGVGLLAGGTLSASGLVSNSPRIERSGLALLFTGAAIYAVLIAFAIGSWAALVPVLTYSVFAWSSLARYRKLGKVLDGIKYAEEIAHPKTPCSKKK